MRVTLYSRSNCHLCDDLYMELQALQKTIPHDLVVIDIDTRKDLIDKYGSEIPVVEVGQFQLKSPISQQELITALEVTQANEQSYHASVTTPPAVNSTFSKPWTKSDSFSYWISKHYLAVFNLIIFLYVGIPFVGPVLMHAGAPAPARIIYRGYSLLCHQLAYRSIFLFGEQPFYPRSAAGVEGYLTYGQATGFSEGDSAKERLEARAFVGNEYVGYKVALCQRDIGIYLGILIFGLVFGLTRKRIPGLPWYLWIIIGLVPIGVDGVSQLISQPPLSFLPYRESTPFLRLLTGFLFGFSTAWFGYPLVEESMKESRDAMKYKKEHAIKEK